MTALTVGDLLLSQTWSCWRNQSVEQDLVGGPAGNVDGVGIQKDS